MTQDERLEAVIESVELLLLESREHTKQIEQHGKQIEQLGKRIELLVRVAELHQLRLERLEDRT
jgi:hypothetical protein